MSIRVDPLQLAHQVMTIMTPSDLGVPPSPPGYKEGQRYEITVGDKFLIFNGDKTTSGVFVVQRWHENPAGAKSVELLNLKSNSSLYLDTWQIGHLERHGLIRPLVMSGSGQLAGNTPGAALCLTDKQKASALRWQAYLDAAANECLDLNNGKQTRRLMEKAVKRLAKERHEKPPSMSSIYRKLDISKVLQNFNPLLALAPKNSMGNREQRFCDRAEEAIREAVEKAWRDPSGTWKTVRAQLYKMTEESEEYFDLANLVRDVGKSKRMLSVRTIQRRFQSVDRFTRDQLRYGPEYAARVHTRRIRQLRPSRPLDVVDVDHTTLGIVVYDDVRGIGYGRPDLVLFRDRHSGIVLGWAISFGPPSLETFLDGFLHALLPKSKDDLPPGVSYPWHGRPVCLGVDNAKHFVGLPIREAAMELGFQILPYRPGHPWEKGALEHLFHILNIQLIDRLLGSTTMSPAERLKFDDDRMKAVPQISLSELDGFLSYYFAEVHHAVPHEGLGEIHTLSATPKELWDAGIGKVQNRPLVDRDMMIAIAGDTTNVTVQPDGVRWEYLVYQSAELTSLTLRHQHKVGAKDHRATQYKAVRDPSDLGRIWLHNPYDGRVLEVPILSAMASYAKGLKLYQHRKIVEQNRMMKRNCEDAQALMTSMNELENQLVEIHNKRSKHGTAARLARFISGQRQRIQRTRAVEVATSGVGRMDYAAPYQGGARSDGPVVPKAKSVVEPEVSQEPTSTEQDHEDIDAIRAKHQGWE
jgi:putative transposase